MGSYRLLLVSLAAFASAALASPAASSDLYVDGTANCPSGAGTAAAPFCTLAEAIAIAVDDDVIHIAPGTYTESFLVIRDLTIVGTGGAAATILDGGGVNRIGAVASGSHLRLENITIANGTDRTGFDQVGGLLILGGLAMVDSIVRDCSADTYAGILHEGSAADDMTLRRCEFYGNGDGSTVTSSFAGGVVPIEDCVFRDNLTSYGDCLTLLFSSAIVSGTSFVSNQGGVSLSVIGAFDSDLQMSNSTVTGNDSGALFLNGRKSVFSSYLQSVTITGNSVLSPFPSGGLQYVSGGTTVSFTVTSSIIAGNVVTGPGSVQAAFVAGASIVSGGHNLIGADDQSIFVDGVMADIVGSVAVPIDPGLSPVGDNGGPTLTHALLAGSPAVGAGQRSGLSHSTSEACRGVHWRATSVPLGGRPEPSRQHATESRTQRAPSGRLSAQGLTLLRTTSSSCTSLRSRRAP